MAPGSACMWVLGLKLRSSCLSGHTFLTEPHLLLPSLRIFIILKVNHKELTDKEYNVKEIKRKQARYKSWCIGNAHRKRLQVRVQVLV